MFSFYRNGIRNHVRLDKKEDFAVPGINDIYAIKILIYVRIKDIKYNTMSSKWVLIPVWRPLSLNKAEISRKIKI